MAAAAALVLAGAVPAGAQPAADPVKQYEELSGQAEKLNDEVLKAQENLDAKQVELTRATADLNAARQAAEQLRGRVDVLTESTFQGARFNQLSALLVSDSQQDFLNRMSALRLLAADNAEALDSLSAAVAKADEQQQRAEQSAKEAAKHADELKQRKSDLDGRIGELRKAVRNLTSAQKSSLGMGQVKDTGTYLGPPGAANTALQAALSKRGSQYLWGGNGPNAFDCSGLTKWAYAAAGITIPRVAVDQYRVGKPVAQNELLPGDLVFYDDGTGNPAAIHHVAMYVGEGKMVDAPTEGQLVDVRALRGDGHYIGARRIVG
ncbi:NlpC/P60 family protein [Lentzea aerocolonigenes]|uniref:NlpC/P60 family protein n=1 Tax=Lentzea aerocolonigenes TaxID=68170 RepID=UPI000A7BB4AF|nr:NlpC/P60 family protein [Lentzea aerocolonigenes]MCP2247341.1 Cell wall-associated hydrolase, NlpC family [Lentzea aerocolonigenes]